jgi:hypothetical protein
MSLMLKVCFFFSLVPVSAALAATSCTQDGRGYVSSANCKTQGMSYTICYVRDGLSRGRLNPGETQEFDAHKGDTVNTACGYGGASEQCPGVWCIPLK